MSDEFERSKAGRRVRSARNGGLWRAIEMLEAAAAEAVSGGDWIDEALAEAFTAQTLAVPVSVVEMPARPLGETDQRAWMHLWRCRPEGLPAARAIQCCSGAVLPDGRCASRQDH